MHGDIFCHRIVQKCTGINNIIDFSFFHQSLGVTLAVCGEIVCQMHINSHFFNGSSGFLCCINGKAQRGKFFGQRDDFQLIVCIDADQHTGFPVDDTGAHNQRGGTKSFEQRFLQRFPDAQYLACGFHFRPQIGIGVGQFFKRKYRDFDSDIRRHTIQAWCRYQAFLSWAPNITREAMSTIGTPVTLEIYGTVRDARR